MVKKKIQLHESSGKYKSLPKQANIVPAPSTSTSNTSLTILDGNPNSEQAQRFELELCWCIQQLQTVLKNGKLGPKQMEEQRKILNTLMSNSAPIIKKRQVMQMTFGNYRAKMEAEEKKYQTKTNASRIEVKAATPSKNSMFIKKSIFATSGKDFRFNFQTPTYDVPDVSRIVINEEKNQNCVQSTETKSTPILDYSFVPSKTEFKFNFVVSEK